MKIQNTNQQTFSGVFLLNAKNVDEAGKKYATYVADRYFSKGAIYEGLMTSCQKHGYHFGLFKGENNNALHRLETDMQKLSDTYLFEQAAKVRDQVQYLINTRRYAQAGDFKFGHNKVLVFIKSLHEQAFVICYIEEGQVKLKKTYPSFESYTKKARDGFAQRICGKDWDLPDDSVSTSALLEISAKRLFVDLTDAKNAEDVVCAMDKGFGKFIET